MGACLFAIDENIAPVIHSSEVEQKKFALPIAGDVYGTVIPHTFNEIGVADSGKFAFRAIRHIDSGLKTAGLFPLALSTALAGIKTAAPIPVE